VIKKSKGEVLVVTGGGELKGDSILYELDAYSYLGSNIAA
jgi:hypothetical protein